MAIQIIGVNKLMSADLDYRSEDAYEVLCKVAAINVAYNCSIFSPSQRACLNSLASWSSVHSLIAIRLYTNLVTSFSFLR